MQFNTLLEFQQYLQSFRDAGEREMAEMAAQLGDLVRPAARKHIVVLLHGMNTNAEWQEALAEPMRLETNLVPMVVGYGNFSPVKFWFPFFYRGGRIKKVLTDLRGIRDRNPDADISIVAHSFGTYVVSKILALATELKFHRILFCGSIVDTDYDWTAVSQQFTEPVINDVGRRDIWPSMAKGSTWGFGDSGTIGFQHSLVRDRHFTYGHSGFLDVSHMRKYWLPYLLDGRVVGSRYSTRRKKMGFLELIGRGVPYKYVIVAVAGFLVWCACHWIIVPLAQFILSA